jgi:hypothetical protein
MASGASKQTCACVWVLVVALRCVSAVPSGNPAAVPGSQPCSSHPVVLLGSLSPEVQAWRRWYAANVVTPCSAKCCVLRGWATPCVPLVALVVGNPHWHTPSAAIAGHVVGSSCSSGGTTLAVPSVF